MAEIVDMLPARTVQALFELRSALPEDTNTHLRRRREYAKELQAKMAPVEGHLAGDPQTGGVVFVRE